MANLFPHWRGRFEGMRPTISRMDGDAVLRTIDGTLLSDGEVNSLRHLIQSPDSHFLKVPVLPFHSLISLLAKFPGDIESRAFWTPVVRDKLFDLACIAVRALLPRVERAGRTGNPEDEHTIELLHALAQTAMKCQVFTGEQVRKFTALLEQLNVPVPDVDSDMSSGRASVTETPSESEQGSTPSMVRTPGERGPGACFADLAKEFGVEAGLVQALANRLAGLS